MTIRTYIRAVDKSSTPQSEALSADQVANSAGGFSFAVDAWTRLDRFLILGSEGGSYYVGERELTLANAGAVRACLKLDGPRTVSRIIEISEGGRAPKNDQAIFALALALKEGDLITRQTAARVVPNVCRIGTHLFQLVSALEVIGGWGRITKRAVSSWYESMFDAPDRLALQLTKYQSREGWSHRDVLRKCHVHPPAGAASAAALRWAVGKVKSTSPEASTVPHLIGAMEVAKLLGPTDFNGMARLISEYRMPRECVPTHFLNSAVVWGALLQSMPMTAMIRNLGKMTNVGLIAPLSDAAELVRTRLLDRDALVRARVHPVQLLMAQSIYKSGSGLKGSLEWVPDPSIVAALEEAFYLSFSAVEPTGARHLIALDVSGSMGSGLISGTNLTPREASAALALVTARVERSHIVAFSSGARNEWIHGLGRSQHVGYKAGISPVDFGPNTRLDEAISTTSRIPMGGTDCALPMLYAMEHKIPVDVFVVITDSETWSGVIHPTEALKKYRAALGINAKLVVVAMMANEFSIADPKDGGMLDVCGFDAATPKVIADFVTDGRAAAPAEVDDL